MPNLPTKSTGSSVSGIWFVFDDGRNCIRAWGSAATGKERVYLNNTLVSEKRSFHRKGAHVFRDKEETYEIQYHTTNLVKGRLECRLFKNGVFLKGLVCHALEGRKSLLKRLLVIVALAAALGIAQFAFQMTIQIYTLLFMLLLFSIFATRLIKKFRFEELN